MSSYDDRNSGRDVPVLPRTGRLKRGATASEAQPQLKLSNTSSNGGPVSGFGPYRSASVGDNISHGRTSSLLHHQDVSRDPFHREPTQDEWHFSLPDSWSCQKNNSAGIVCDEFGLRLVSPGFGRTRKRTTAESAGEVSSRTLTGVSSRALDIIDVALVVANKPIPMVTLIRQADKRQAELAETHSLSTRALKAAAAASEPLSSPPTFSAAGANEKPSSPSRNESLGGGSIFPLKFVKPKRHKRKNSNEITDNGQIADLSSLVGMVAPKAHTCSGGGSYMGKTKTVKEIYDGLLSQNDVGANAGSVTNRMEESDRYTAPAIPYPAPKLELPSFVYYFEVTIMSGSAWVGLVAAENVVTHEQAHFMMGKSSSGDGSACYGGLLDAATTPNPFPILMHQIPGKSPESIGLGNNGELHIGGSMVGRDGKIVHSFTSHHGEPWAAPFVANNDGTSSGVFAGMGEGETVGCGWEIGGKRRVFFTHNGKVLHPERPIDGFDARGSAMFPSVGMETQGTNLVANFGLDPTTPLRFKGNAEFLPITLPITRAADKSIDEDPNTIEDADGQVPLSKFPSDVSNCTPAVIRSDYGDDHLRSAVVGDNNDRGAQTVRPGDEDSELEAVLKKSMDETSARVPDAEARPPITREGIEEAKVIARELRSLAENPEGADPLRLKSLLELCRSMQEHVVSTLQQESVSVDFESLFDLTGVLQHSIDSAKAAETEIRDLSQPGQGRMTSLDKAHLDATTMEWTDGVFTSILRTILSNQKGEADKRHWVVFDGDVDPEWAENLNSVLDDNKLLTLPSGERLGIPDNMRIILEVDSLKQATPATVSRCGMIWFSNDTLSDAMRLQHLLDDLLTEDISGVGASEGEELPSAHSGFLDATKHMFVSEDERVTSIVADALDFALSRDHIMTPTRERLLTSLKALVVKGIQEAIEYDENHPDFPMSGEHMDNFAKRWVLHSLVWSFAGSASWAERSELSEMLLRTSGMILPGGEGTNLTDYRVRSSDGEYELWSESVPRMEIESHKVTATDVVIATTDTVRHTEVLGSWLSSRKPLILCGPAGSGKSMTTNSVLQDMQGIVLASLNFSSRTTPEIILKTFDQYCSYVRRGKDTVLEPMENLGAQSWLVIFCDEINLPEEDTYGTQRVIMFMRQLVEQGGFWRNDNTWVKIDRIQFVGACNPPTDAGRVNMSQRFLRHAPLLLVDFPATDSLKQIYRTFNGGMMKLFPDLKGETEPLTEAMVELYSEAKEKFKPEAQPQYFYSPRELSRWVRGIYESIVDQDQGLTKEELVRIWAHEGLRLFCDRLVEVEERKWCEEKVDNVARKWFAAVDHDKALARPLFYSTWLSKDTRQVSRDELRDFLAARLRVFYEEQLDVPLVIFDEVLEHILRIDRVLRQPMGHCLLVGDSGAGKTVLSKFVSWMNGLNIFQIKAHSRYGIDEFNEDLRGVMRRVGIDGEKVCFIFDEGNILGSGFLEAMNALLASGEVPGLFEGDEYTALMSACRDSAARDGVILDSDEELWRRFTSIVQRNLHVVFTMNPSGGDWKNRSTASPALFNRCVVDWFGTWSAKAMGEVGKEFTMKLDMGDAESVGGSWGIGDGEVLMENVAGAFEGVASGGLRQAVVGALVEMHSIVKSMADEVAHAASSVSRTFLSPRDYLALIRNFVDCVNFRREEVEDEQLHVNAGLSKLTQTQENVAELRVNLAAKTSELRQKEVLANKKLQQMVGDQNIAEKRKEEAELMSENVAKQQEQIDARKAEAQRDLDDAEPALIAAQTSVKSIKKRDLDEIRNLARPPNNVKLTLECVAIMLGEKKTEWVDIRKLISKTEFIPSILSFDADTLSDRQVKIVDSGYLTGNADLTVESVTRSSKACGPLYKWAESQVKYSSVYNRVEPLRQEVEQLEQEAQVAKDEKLRIEKEVAELESSISQYKDDYAALIRDVEALKSESEVVTKKVDRAESLIKSLSQESERWSKSKETFQNILRSLVGDGLLMAAFLTYSGFFDFRGRIVLMKRWREVLDALGIEYREGLSMVESLSKASERLEWESLGLPSDALSLENGVVLEHCVRFPLIIDPSGQAIDFIMNRYKGEKIQSTSFLDKAFMKTLAGAVRFGTTLLVENVESVDPVLNPILNKEIQRTGGRSLVRIGTEDVDYSPKFNIILTTKNPAAKLTPDLCSRVTLVNFTVTPASLQSQSMSRIMQEEKPQVEARRKDILKLQGEQNVKLRELEEKMLNMISAVEGSILDDDRVVTGMETLMKEGAQVEEQIAESADVMKEVQRAISAFEPLGSTCRELFILLTAMRDISFLYEFSATAFMSILECVLVKMGPVEGSDEKERASQLKLEIFTEAAARIGRSLSAEDKMVFGLHLARLFSKDDSIVDGSKARSLSEISSTIENLFGDEFPWQGRGLNCLHTVVESDVTSAIPLLLCSAPGHDVSGRVEAMAREHHKELSSVAMGSAEGFDTAAKILGTASKRGTWVLLKNCHLCTEWLAETLVKKLHSLGAGAHKDFRLFLTSEISPKLPTGLLRLSDVIVAEAPTGVKASISRFVSRISSDRFESAVTNRIYLVLAWVHAVIQERLCYIPAGWTERYEFTEADAIHALDAIDTLISDSSEGRGSIDPEKLPWDAMRATLCRDIFGGRVTKQVDQEVLDNLVDSVFVCDCFNVNFKLADADGAPTLPDGTSKDECFAWIESLPSHTLPTWIGLDANAEEARAERIAKSVLKNVGIVEIARINDE